MPVEVKGIVEAQKALKKFAPDLYKEMNKEIRAAMKVVVDDARGMVQSNVYQLESWQDKGNPVVSRTGRTLGFPRYNEVLVKKGLTYSLGRSRRNSAGFVSVYRLLNKSRVGAIIETAGRKNFNGDPKSQSNNPNAGAHFNRAIQGTYGGFKSIGSRRTDKGRLLFAAVAKDQGRVTEATFRAIQTATNKFNSSLKRRIGLAA
jgi:hypothetical protein